MHVRRAVFGEIWIGSQWMLFVLILLMAVLSNCSAQDTCARDDALVTATGRTCGVSCSTTADCRRNRECVCDGACGLSCIPTARTPYCVEVPANPNVTLTYENPDGRTFDSTVTAVCKEGFKYESGDATRKCQGDGTWSGDAYNCMPITCGQPTYVVENAALHPDYFQDSYEVNKWISYRCDYGYYRDGMIQIMCQATGEWTEPDFVCRPKTCPPPRIPNGYIEGSYSFGEQIQITCYTGYELDGLPYKTCQGDQMWSGYDVTCNKVKCPALSAPTNGIITGNNQFEYNDEVSYRCNEGYIVEPKSGGVRTCQADKTWSGPAEVTTCREINCGEPQTHYKNFDDTTLIGGSLVGNDFTFDSVVYFQCNNGYTLDGSRSTRCENTETWSAPVPKCNEPTKPVIQAPQSPPAQPAEVGQCEAPVEFTVPAATDNSGKVHIECISESGDTFSVGNSTGTFNVGNTIITCTAIDPSDNEVTVQLTITVNDNEDPVFTSTPADKLQLKHTAGKCYADATPVMQQVLIASDNCGNGAVEIAKPEWIRYAVGKTVVVYTATDKAGNSVTFSQTISVPDTEPPKISISQVGPLQADEGKRYKTLDLTLKDMQSKLEVTDNCNERAQINVQCTPSVPNCKDVGEQNCMVNEEEFRIYVGETTIPCNVSDLSGNSKIFNYRVNVKVLCNHPPPPVCEVKHAVPDSSLDKGPYEAGTNIYCHCEPGYYMVATGVSGITCQESGEWSEPKFTCVAIFPWLWITISLLILSIAACVILLVKFFRKIICEDKQTRIKFWKTVTCIIILLCVPVNLLLITLTAVYWWSVTIGVIIVFICLTVITIISVSLMYSWWCCCILGVNSYVSPKEKDVVDGEEICPCMNSGNGDTNETAVIKSETKTKLPGSTESPV